MKIDFLIVGQGLAGSLLAWALIQRGCRVMVADSGCTNASQVAAGIVNPVTGKRFAKTADIEALLPAAIDCYGQLSAFFGEPFYVRKKMFRLFRDDPERNQALKRIDQAIYSDFLGDLSASNDELDGFLTPFGMIEQLQCGHLLTAPLLSRLKNFFIETKSYCQTVVDYQSFQFNPEIKWNGLTAGQVVFCEGYRAIHNPWFNGLGLRPVKGEILTLDSSTLLPDAIVNNGNWLLPSSPGKFRVGATFDRSQIDCRPTDRGKDVLLASLRLFQPELAESTVIDHQAGIRPCSSDRYPIIGRHPENSKLTIFNGFGSKGSVQIPWYSQRFADYLLSDSPLPYSCDVRRFKAPHPVS